MLSVIPALFSNLYRSGSVRSPRTAYSAIAAAGPRARLANSLPLGGRNS
jgi:hypothetical protein